MKKRFLSLYLMMTMLLLTGCGSGSSTNDKTLRIAYFPNVTHTQALVMKEQGTLEKELGDWNVNWVDFNAGTSEIEAFFAGEIDLGYIGPVPAVSGNVKSNGDIQIIAGATNGGSVLVARKGTNIKSIQDLANRKVAIPSLGNTQHLLLCKLLSDNNMAAKTAGGVVDVTAVENADTIAMMDSGKIDAALVPEPWGSQLSAKCGAEVVMDYKDIWNEGNYSTTVVVVRKEFAEQHADIVEKFMKVHKSATAYIVDNQEEAGKIANNQIKSVTGKELDSNILKSTFSRIIASSEIPKSSIMEYANVSMKEKFISKVPEEKSLFNDSFLK